MNRFLKTNQITIVLLFLVSSIIFCCSTNRDVIAALPLLPPSQHLGYIEGFNPDNPPVLRQVMDQCWEQARNRGMNTARVQMDWLDLEPQPNIISMDELVERLDPFYQQDMPIFLLLTTIDSDSFNYPADLVSEDRQEFSNGMRADDPVIVERYKALMQQVLPVAKEYGVFCISIGNEPDTHHERDPNLLNEFLNFVSKIRTFSNEIEPEIAITYTSTIDPVVHQHLNYRNNIIDSVDVFSINFYGIGSEQGLDLQQTENVLQGIVDFASNKQIIIQELGCSSKYLSDKHFNFFPSSNETQDQFYQWVFPKIQSYPQIRAAYIFQLVENSPLVDEIWLNAFEGSGIDPVWIAKVVEAIDGLGLISFEEAQRKPAWFTFLGALETYQEAREAGIDDWQEQ